MKLLMHQHVPFPYMTWKGEDCIAQVFTSQMGQ